MVVITPYRNAYRINKPLNSCMNFEIRFLYQFCIAFVEWLFLILWSIYISDEIAKQLISCKAKLLIGSVEGYPALQAALNKLQTSIKLISIKATDDQSIPAGTIDFQELIKTTGKTRNTLKLMSVTFNLL